MPDRSACTQQISPRQCDDSPSICDQEMQGEPCAEAEPVTVHCCDTKVRLSVQPACSAVQWKICQAFKAEACQTLAFAVGKAVGRYGCNATIIKLCLVTRRYSCLLEDALSADINMQFLLDRPAGSTQGPVACLQYSRLQRKMCSGYSSIRL
jgi:hypothetical protein